MASLSLHGKVIGGTFALLILFGVAQRWSADGTGAEKENPVIALEHGSPVTFSLTLNKRGSVRVVDIDHTAKDTVFVSVPEHWRRTEIRGVALAAVTAEAPQLGFVRYTLPARAGITFRSEGTWEHITVENPRHVLMTLKFTGVDADKNISTHDVVLIKDQKIIVP